MTSVEGKIMKTISEGENKTFKKMNNDCYSNTLTDETITADNSNNNDYFNDSTTIRVYRSGLLYVSKKNYMINIYFLKNDGTKLFDITKKDMSEMANDVHDINAMVCNSGVLVVCNYYDGDEYVYHTYNGALIKANNFDTLRKRVEYFESNPREVYDNGRDKPMCKGE